MKKGLYANIHAKRLRIKKGSGETMRKPGTKGAPTAANFKRSAKTANTGDGGDAVYAQSNGQDSVSGRGYDGATGVLYIAYKGPQRGEGGTVSTTARPGYTTHTFTAHGEDTFIA